ncbi:MAG: YgaP family membrane protein [bacterium]
MTVEEALRLTAGIVVGVSVLLAVYHSPNWLWLTGFVSLNLIQSAFTGTCPAKWFYGKCGLDSVDKDNNPAKEE